VTKATTDLIGCGDNDGACEHSGASQTGGALPVLKERRADSPAERMAIAFAYAKLGKRLFSERRYGDAVEAYEQSLRYTPHQPAVLSNLGAACSLAGLPEKSEDYLRRAISQAPGFLASRSNLLLSLHYTSRWTPAKIAAEHKRFGRAWVPLCPSPPPMRSVGNVRRRLRIGYVSSDFRRHPVGRFIEPILANHDRRRFDVICYHAAPVEDETTTRLRAFGHGWRSLAELDDDRAADLVRKDKCDILIDLNGHTHGNRLGVFARQAAPVQATYLGYPDGTGLRSIQYRLTDTTADPPGMTEKLYTEKLVRLAGCFLCFRPPAHAPRVRPARTSANESFLFGSLNQCQKISDFTLGLWAEILLAVPRSRLLLQSLSLCDPQSAARLCERFESAGIDRPRLELIGYSNGHLNSYNCFDLALDPFPFHGATTTCEALWMGTPVVSLEGRAHVSRMGTTLLESVGLSGFIAKTRDDYVRIACGWAEDPAKLKRVRKGLRRRVAKSVLCDESGFTANLEKALIGMWRD
jgi:protein O-GlcNAc transferase